MAQARDERRRLEIGSVVDDKWRVVRLLGEGAFGAVYEVTDIERPGKLFALKLESNENNPDSPPKLLTLEVTVLRALRDIGAKYYPGYESCGQNEKFNYLVMGLVGKNIDALCKGLPTRKFTLHAALHVGTRSLIGLEEIHRAGFLHRDLKPANMCIGRAPDDLRSVYILDWGLCRRYLNDKGKVHRPREKASFRGTPRYASANAMNGVDQGRLDDIWSWFFGLIDLTVGRLPWDNVNYTDFSSFMQKVASKKSECMQSVELLCQGCPVEYGLLFEMVHKLQYYDQPKYTEIAEVLKNVRKRKNLPESNVLDWEPTAEFEKQATMVPNATMMHNENRKKST